MRTRLKKPVFSTKNCDTSHILCCKGTTNRVKFPKKSLKDISELLNNRDRFLLL